MTTKIPVVAAALALLSVLAGCASRYDMVLTNHNTITVMGQPKYDHEHEVYRFKDAKGDTHIIAALRVANIAPHKKAPPPPAPANIQWTKP